jgi:hypothetical protein
MLSCSRSRQAIKNKYVSVSNVAEGRGGNASLIVTRRPEDLVARQGISRDVGRDPTDLVRRGCRGDFCARFLSPRGAPALVALQRGSHPRSDLSRTARRHRQRVHDVPWPVLCAEVSKLKIEPVGVRIPRGLVDKARYTAVTGEQSSRNRWTKRATPAGFETQVEPNLSADLHKGIERLQVPLGSDDITWRGQKSVRFGPKLAPEGWSAPTGMSARWGRWERRPRAPARPDRSLS